MYTMHLNSLSRINLFLTFLAVSLISRALTIDGYTANENDRFANNETFIAHDFDLSGLAISSDGKWATMISPNVFLTAWHYTPSTGQTITFYASNDSTGLSVTRTVTSTQQQIGTSDLRAVVLNLPLPEGYKFYTRAAESASTWYSFRNRYPYRDKEHFHFGRSPGSYATPLDVGVGKNVVDLYNSAQTVSNSTATGPSIGVTVDSDNSAVDYETYALDGDSGAPLMIESNGSLKLVGISWYRTTIGDPAEPYSTGFSPVGDHNSDINTFLTTYSLPYQPLAPTHFSAIRISSTQIDLSWLDQSEVETAYQIERAESAEGPWTVIATLDPDIESYSDTPTPAGDVYYRLVAQNDTDSDAAEAAALTLYSTWAAQYDWGDSDQSPAGDANSDGSSNLEAYSMNLSPVDPLPVDAAPYLETPTDYVDFFYRKNSDATDLTYTLQQTADLINPDWQSVLIDGSTVTETDMGAVDTARLIRIRMQSSILSTLTFFRLEIETDDPP